MKTFYGCFVACLGLKTPQFLPSRSPPCKAQGVTADTAAGQRVFNESSSILPARPCSPWSPFSSVCPPLFCSNQLCNKLEKRGPEEDQCLCSFQRDRAACLLLSGTHTFACEFLVFTNSSVFNKLLMFSE